MKEKEGGIDRVTEDMLGDDWQAVKGGDGQYATLGSQWIEHEIHDLINAAMPERAHTSNHKPVSVQVTVRD